MSMQVRDQARRFITLIDEVGGWGPYVGGPGRMWRCQLCQDSVVPVGKGVLYGSNRAHRAYQDSMPGRVGFQLLSPFSAPSHQPLPPNG